VYLYTYPFPGVDQALSPLNFALAGGTPGSNRSLAKFPLMRNDLLGMSDEDILKQTLNISEVLDVDYPADGPPEVFLKIYSTIHPHVGGF
jgi:hypothetical protein